MCVMRRSPPANYATPSVCARGLHMPPPAKACGSQADRESAARKKKETSGRMFRDFKEQRGGALDP